MVRRAVSETDNVGPIPTPEAYLLTFMWYYRYMLDIRGIPTPVCPCCHSTLLRLTVEFDPQTYEIAGYLLDDAQCMECKCLITAPTPLDHPDYEA